MLDNMLHRCTAYWVRNHLPNKYPAARVSTEAGNSSTVEAVYAAPYINGPKLPDAVINPSRS